VIIEALKLDGPAFKDVRTTAIEALKKWTGQGNLGYLPDSDDKAEREAAIARWEAWYKAEGPALVRRSLAPIDKSEVPDEDKAKAIDRWRDGNKALDELAKKEGDLAAKGQTLDPRDKTVSYETAVYLFREALKLDPNLVSARISCALILYEQLRRPREAEAELKLVLTRFAPEDATYPRLLANYHLARLCELEGDYTRADKYYSDATRLDDTFYDGFTGMGDCAFARALAAQSAPPAAGGAGGGTPAAKPPADGSGKPNPPSPDDEARKQRNELLLRAMNQYRFALDAIDRRSQALVKSAQNVGGLTGEIESPKEGRLLNDIRESREDLDKRAAAVWFRLGRVESARGDDKEALAAFRSARALNPKDEAYARAAAMYEAAAAAAGDSTKPAAPGKDGK
jgi:tetratricopeptide (TPR) repeat protein